MPVRLSRNMATPSLTDSNHGLTIETGVAHCRIIVVARLVSPVFRVFLAALSADVRMVRSHRRLLGRGSLAISIQQKRIIHRLLAAGQVTHLNSKHYIVILARHHRTNHGCDGSSGMPSTSPSRMPPACFMLWQLMHIDIKPSIAGNSSPPSSRATI
jgi:hypothetical protein